MTNATTSHYLPKKAKTGTKRIAVNQKVARMAEELQEVLGVSTISDVFGLLLTRYGQHLKHTWLFIQSPPNPPTVIQPTPNTQHHVTPSHPQIEEDPLIQRLAGLLDSF